MNLAVAALTHRQVEPRSLDVDIELPRRPPAHRHHPRVYGDRLVAVGYSKLNGKQLLESWVRLLALAAGHPDHNWTALTIGRAPRGSQAAQRLLGPTVDEPLTLLSGLVDLYDEGRRAPLPLPIKTPFAWATRGPHRPGAQAPRRCKKWETQPLPRRGRRPRPRPGLGRARRPRRAARRRLAELARAALAAPAAAASGGRCDRPRPVRPARPAARAARARPCSRPAPAPARPTRSRRWSPATSPRAGAARRDAARHLRPGGQPGAARAGPRPAGRGRAGARRPGARSAPTTTLLCAPGRRHRRASVPSGGNGCATRSPASTPPPSRPPTSSASWCCGRSVSPETPTPGSPWSRTSTTWSSEIVDDLYLRAFGREGRPGVQPRARRSRSPARWSRDPRTRLTPSTRRPRPTAGVRRALRRRRVRRARAAQAPARHPRLRRPARPAARRAGGRRRRPRADAAALADRAGRRVPGHRPGAVGGASSARSSATPRWC